MFHDYNIVYTQNMIVRAVYDIVVHLESFRNIELYYQGLYFLKINVFSTDIEGKVTTVAHPYAHTEHYNPYESEDNKSKFYDSQVVKPGSITEATSSFNSKCFIIKFCQEEVELNDICHFRIEFEISQHEREQLFVEASLMFYDYMTNKNKETKEEKNQDKVFGNAKLVNTKRFQVNQYSKGIHQYCPILFDEHYFSTVNMLIHTICLDYKFRVNSIQLSQFSRLNPREKLMLLDQNKKIDRKNISIYDSMLKSMGLKSNSASLEAIQNVIIIKMKQAYQSLYQHYYLIAGKCIHQKQRKLFKQYLSAPNKLSLPFEDKSLLKMPFYERIINKFKSKDPEYIANSMLSQSSIVSGQLFHLWHKTLDLYKIAPRYCVALLEMSWMKKQKALWKGTIDRRYRLNADFSLSQEYNNTEKEKFAAAKREQKRINQGLFDVGFFPNNQNLPVIFEDCHIRDINHIDQYQLDEDQQYKGVHLFVFVHGFQGNSYDLKTVKNYLSFLHPQSMFLCSTSNEQLTDGDILEMGVRLASQIKQFIAEHCPYNTLGRLSFIGHSLGGLKIRAALPHLSEFQEKMYTYISFSSPHLGFLYNSNSLIDAGIWILNKMKNSLCLKQLSLTDAQNLEDTALFKLGQFKGLGWFKHLFLFGSKQDSYAPYESARIEICKDAYGDKKNGPAYIGMIKKLINDVKSSRLHRLDVSFCINKRNLDSFIGRTAHIMFLQCQPLIKSIIFNYDRILA